MRFLNEHFVRAFRHIAPTHGIQSASEKLLQELEIDISRTTGVFEDKGPNLIIASHHGLFDPFILLSLIHRKDIYIVGVSLYKRFGHVFSEHLLPIYLSHKPSGSVLEWIRVWYYTRKEGFLDRQEAIHMNQDSLRHAAKIISMGGAVIMFPVGGDLTGEEKWKKGVGYLIKEITNPQTNITMVHIRGSKFFAEMFRYMHPIMHRILYRNEHVSIRIAPSFSIKEIQDTQSPKEIIKFLQQRYKKIFHDL